MGLSRDRQTNRAKLDRAQKAKTEYTKASQGEGKQNASKPALQGIKKPSEREHATLIIFLTAQGVLSIGHAITSDVASTEPAPLQLPAHRPDSTEQQRERFAS